MRKFNWIMGVWMSVATVLGGACAIDPTEETIEDDSESSQADLRGKANGIGDPCMGQTQRNDGNVCNGIEDCVSGHCVAGTALNCDDANDCTNDTCNASTGCNNVAVMGAHLCSQQPLGYCLGGTCMSGIGNECSTTLPCPTSPFECAVATCVNDYCVNYAKADGTPCNDALGMCYQGECN